MKQTISPDEERLIEKLHKIETLFARTTIPGERKAAETAADRIRLRLQQLEKAERSVEYRFTLPDTWSKALFIALLRRYDLKPYRYRAQRRTTVMVKVAVSFVNEVLWPEFRELNETLRAHLDSVTIRIIHQAIHVDETEVEERAAQEGGASADQGALALE